ncbi:MAG TPA: crosslink repair DNA glycosylase YcaQ family protein [Propionibacteriaceae bacterium]
MRRLGRDEARQLAVRAQLLDATKPTDLVDLVDHLTLLQVDPTAAIAPNADLVAWSRLGPSYRPADLTQALEKQRTLFELRAYIRPMTAVALHVPEDTGYGAHLKIQSWLAANDRFRRDIIARLRDAGPLLSRDVPDTSQVPWGSTGWTNDRNVTQMLELLSASLFDFEYVLEMYKPAEKRRWGYFALPVLHHDRLVGKLDARTSRKADTLIINALHEDIPFTGTMGADVEAEIEALAAWLGLRITQA